MVDKIGDYQIEDECQTGVESTQSNHYAWLL